MTQRLVDAVALLLVSSAALPALGAELPTEG
jgi:hypothetical protein